MVLWLRDWSEIRQLVFSSLDCQISFVTLGKPFNLSMFNLSFLSEQYFLLSIQIVTSMGVAR